MLTRCLNGKAQCTELPRLAQPGISSQSGLVHFLSEAGRGWPVKKLVNGTGTPGLCSCASPIGAKSSGGPSTRMKLGHGQKNLTLSLLPPSCESESDNRSL
jgi:hypothetical protein